MARGKTWALGTTIFAATMMLVIGVFQFFQGLAAAIRGGFFFVTPNYVYAIDTTAWGWIHMMIGAVLVLTGCFLFTGATWARVIGIALVALSAIANFLFLPYYPVWSLMIIAADIAIIWALATAPMGVGAGGMPSEAMARSGHMPQHTSEQQMQEPGKRWPATNQPPGRAWTGEPPKAPPDRTSPQERARQQAAQAAEASAEQRGSSGPMAG